MEIHVYEGKNLVELKEKALTELNASEEELYIRESEETKGFLKSKKYKLEIVTKNDVVKYDKDNISLWSKVWAIFLAAHYARFGFP